MEIKSKTQAVLNYLKVYGSITPMEATDNFNLYRLGSVIFSLRKRGYNITTEDIPFTNQYGKKSSYAKYHLIEE